MVFLFPFAHVFRWRHAGELLEVTEETGAGLEAASLRKGIQCVTIGIILHHDLPKLFYAHLVQIVAERGLQMLVE